MIIDAAFAYHTPSETGLKLMTHFREQFSKLLSDINNAVPHCRERSLMVTHLEEASTWLNKAINRTDPSAVAQDTFETKESWNTGNPYLRAAIRAGEIPLPDNRTFIGGVLAGHGTFNPTVTEESEETATNGVDPVIPDAARV